MISKDSHLLMQKIYNGKLFPQSHFWIPQEDKRTLPACCRQANKQITFK
jgi:hypothetical protein